MQEARCWPCIHPADGSHKAASESTRAIVPIAELWNQASAASPPAPGMPGCRDRRAIRSLGDDQNKSIGHGGIREEAGEVPG